MHSVLSSLRSTGSRRLYKRLESVNARAVCQHFRRIVALYSKPRTLTQVNSPTTTTRSVLSPDGQSTNNVCLPCGRLTPTVVYFRPTMKIRFLSHLQMKVSFLLETPSTAHK